MVKKLKKNNQVICTSRHYPQVTRLAKIRKFNLILVGRHGGSQKYDKLNASLTRTQLLSSIINREKPGIAVSFCSPEAARVAYGLGIKHIAFCDSPHAEAVMRLSVPLIQKLLIPWIIPKKEFAKFGIDAKDIIQYKSIDAASILKRTTKKIKLPFDKKRKKTVLVRIEEDQAAYFSKSSKINPIIKEIIKEFGQENIVVLGRYSSQINRLNQTFKNKIKVLNMSIDGKILLENVDAFLGSGGTMTAESAFLGVPTISYNAIPNLVEKYLVAKKLVKRQTNPKLVTSTIKGFFRESANSKNKTNRDKRIKKILQTMEDDDPYQILVKTVKSISKGRSH